VVYRGHGKDGVAVLDEMPIIEVQVAVMPPNTDESTLGERLMKFAGKLEGLPADLARNHDYYLHGSPDQSPGVH
jgi:hypothetical protein